MTEPVPTAADDALAAALHGEEKSAIPEAGLLGRWIDAGGYVFAAAIGLSALILLSEVFLRYVLNAPTIWAHETTTFLCGVSFLYGGLFCASRDSHIRVVLIYDLLPPRGRQAMDVVISAASALAAAFFAYAAWLMVEKSLWSPTGGFQMERSGSAWNPPTPALVKTFLLGMLLLLTLQFIVLTFNHARRSGGHTPTRSADDGAPE
ncbi:TRAP transporter small permease subunit [Salipiger sp.]|uniref:TRAP transporter small permease subunit n=1 Tax=Salipiger sp. TaxID=2078585 RepID=UPI003A97B958